MLLKCYTCYVSKFPIPKQGSSKKCSNHQRAVLISHASKVMLKICQAKLQHYVNQELPDIQVGFRKGRGTRDQIANIHWIKEKGRNFREKKKKKICLCFIDYNNNNSQNANLVSTDLFW